jgi:hypothetical protein
MTELSVTSSSRAPTGVTTDVLTSVPVKVSETVPLICSEIASPAPNVSDIHVPLTGLYVPIVVV